MGEEEEEGRRGAAVMQTTPQLFIYKCDVGGVIKSAGGALGRSDIMENERKMKRNDKCSPDDSAPFHGHPPPPPLLFLHLPRSLVNISRESRGRVPHCQIVPFSTCFG